jgi:hypothetical protein
MITFRVHAMQGRISPYMYPILQLHTACLHAFFFSWSPVSANAKSENRGSKFFRSGQGPEHRLALRTHSLARL